MADLFIGCIGRFLRCFKLPVKWGTNKVSFASKSCFEALPGLFSRGFQERGSLHHFCESPMVSSRFLRVISSFIVVVWEREV